MKSIYLGIITAALAIFCVILLVDRFRINMLCNQVDDKLAEKQQQLNETHQTYQLKISRLEEQIRQLEEQFCFVTEYRTLIQPVSSDSGDAAQDGEISGLPHFQRSHDGTFSQLCSDPGILKIAKELSKKVSQPVTADGIRTVFLDFLATDEFDSAYVQDPKNHRRLINLDAAILETLCQLLDFKCQTSFCWDMKQMHAFCISTIWSAAEKPLTIQYRKDEKVPVSDDDSEITIQKFAVTTLLRFPAFRRAENETHELMLNFHKIPVGGLYIHRFRAERQKGSDEKEWLLEYRFRQMPPESERNTPPHLQWKTPRATKLQAVSLLNGKPIISALSSGGQTFRVPFINGKSDLLVFGDVPIIPEKITALPLKAR